MPAMGGNTKGEPGPKRRVKTAEKGETVKEGGKNEGKKINGEVNLNPPPKSGPSGFKKIQGPEPPQKFQTTFG